MQKFSMKIENSISSLETLMPPVSKFLRQRPISPKTAYVVSLMLEEIITNIVKYAYDDSESRDIDIGLTIDDKTVVIRIQDDGRKFDPSGFPEPDTSLPVEKRTDGGLGIHLVRKMSESMKYWRENDRNFLEILILRTIE